jgi:hypothetical protein
MTDILVRLGGLRDRLQTVEGGKIKGSFRGEADLEKIPRGQAVLDSIMSECFCLVAEIQT